MGINESDVVLYCRHTLNIKKVVDIHITECCLKHDNAWGWTYDEVEGEIDIELDINLSGESKLLTLCHEMVHAWQFSEGRESDEAEALKMEGVLRDGYKRHAGINKIS